MPRTARRILKRFVDGETEVLAYELERSLLHGQGCLGTALELRVLDDWQRHWARWRDVVLPKVLEHRPGTRPFAMYVTGEIPARPVLTEPPLSNNYFKVYVPGRNGTGQWHHDYPEPFMQHETDYLSDLGIVDAEERRRWRAWCKRGGCTYPDELGLHE
jgi:hypothetical protein